MKSIFLLVLVSIFYTNLYCQDFCDNTIFISDGIEYSGILDPLPAEIDACDGINEFFFTYGAVHEFNSSNTSGTATITFSENHASRYEVIIFDNCDSENWECIYSSSTPFNSIDLSLGDEFCIENNSTYYIFIVEKEIEIGGTLDYSIQIDLPDNSNAQNFCDEAIFLSNGIEYSGSLTSNPINPYEACGSCHNSYDVIHAFTSQDEGIATVTFTADNPLQFDRLYLYNCDTNNWNCLGLNGPTIPIEANTSYYIFIVRTFGENEESIDYTIQVDYPHDGNTNSNCSDWLNDKIESDSPEYCSPEFVCAAFPSEYYYKVFETTDGLIIIEKFACIQGVIEFYYKNGDLSSTCDLSYLNDVITPDCFLNDYPFELNNNLLFNCESSLPANIELDAIGMPCDDGNPNTPNDVIQEDCSCQGDSQCEITSVQLISVECFDNGTPNDESDDFFEITINVSGESTGDNFIIIGNCFSALGNYNEDQTFTECGLTNPVVTYVITDMEDANCQFTLEIDFSEFCNNFCSEAIILNDGVQHLGILELNNFDFNACDNNYSSYWAVHTFESLENESVTISFSEEWFGAFDLIVLEGCDPTNLNCIFSTFAGQEVTDGVSIDIDSNTSYYIMVAEVATGNSGELDYSIQIDFDGTSSTKDLDNSQVNVYPNPANEVLFISSLEEIIEIQCIDRTGRIIFSKVEGLNQIDISSLDTGTYLMCVKTRNGFKYYNKFVKL